MEIESKLRIVIAQPVSLHRISLLFYFFSPFFFFFYFVRPVIENISAAPDFFSSFESRFCK